MNITGTTYLNHLTEYSKLTDKDIIQKASTNFVLDVLKALTMYLERDLSKMTINEIILKIKQ